ncbi:MAG: hypothetical protein J5U19_12665 [Candidatus Methanoperedens sp.]|nr:hypothetical protein [Candidatus Methanoperedens sp.]
MHDGFSVNVEPPGSWKEIRDEYILSKSHLVLWQHTLMIPAMVVPMLFRLDIYTGRAGHLAHAHH